MTNPAVGSLRFMKSLWLAIAVVACGGNPAGDGNQPIVPGVFDAQLSAASAPAAGLILTVRGLSEVPDLTLGPGMSGRSISTGNGEYRILVTGLENQLVFMHLRVANDQVPPELIVREAAGSATAEYRPIPVDQVEVALSLQ